MACPCSRYNAGSDWLILGQEIKLIFQEIIIKKCQNCLLTQTFLVYNPSSVWKITVTLKFFGKELKFG